MCVCDNTSYVFFSFAISLFLGPRGAKNGNVRNEEGRRKQNRKQKKVSDFVTVYNSPGFLTIVVFQSTHRKRRMRERERMREKKKVSETIDHGQTLNICRIPSKFFFSVFFFNHFFHNLCLLLIFILLMHHLIGREEDSK